jgi:hypothetical protein
MNNKSTSLDFIVFFSFAQTSLLVSEAEENILSYQNE